ncbi:MAG TPA: DUF1343 domain-containing protein [Candidatus Paceibacterota bacterium]|nr:DUF1343 domain-containing protein [Candidatus Paceibacterota bacterium]HRZ54681.1 DUF1343 domain-containing protein [Candidatus Paceibacterota bacterium]
MSTITRSSDQGGNTGNDKGEWSTAGLRRHHALPCLPLLGLLLGLMQAQAQTPAQAPVELGIDTLAGRGWRPLAGKRIGLITNPTGVDRRGRSTIDRLRAAPRVKLVALFAPEHGLRGDSAAGKEFPDSKDPRTGLPVYSLYGPGPVRKPTPKMLRGIDVLLYDVQDLGVRSYTYISTMGLAMEACGEAGIEFMVLDRPNPLGGARVEGPMLDPRFRSFVGWWEVPYVYGLTCGELARMINGEGWTAHRCKLTVIPMSGWSRTMTWKATRLPWVPTSPNVKSAETGLFLVATGVLGEIGGVSIGMGTDMPFQCIAAPWLKSDALASHFAGLRLRGVQFSPVSYTPSRGMFQGQRVSGVRIRFSEPDQAPLVAINYYALEAVRQVAGRDLFALALKRGQSFQMLDRVNGTDSVRRALQEGRSARGIVASWKAGEDAFRKRRAPYLLYR